MKVYVNDLLIKSTETGHHISNFEEAFGELQWHQMKLHPNKCTFDVTSEKFLGFLVTQYEIEATPEKIRTLK